MIHYRTEMLTVFRSALYQTTSTVLHTPDLIVVVDPCWLPHEVAEIRHFVEGIQGDRPLYLLFTHADFDHIIGYRAFPGAEVIATEELQNYPDKAKKLRLIAEFDAQYYIDRGYPVEFPHVDRVIERDGQQVRVGETVLTFYKAPGHSHDGMFTVVEGHGIFIAGDYLSDAEFPFLYHSGEAYDETMRKAARILQDHDIRLLIPGHGNVTSDRREMERRIAESEQYLADVRRHLQSGNQAELDRMIEGGKYALMQKSFHVDNQNLLRKEMQK